MRRSKNDFWTSNDHMTIYSHPDLRISSQARKTNNVQTLRITDVFFFFVWTWLYFRSCTVSVMLCNESLRRSCVHSFCNWDKNRKSIQRNRQKDWSISIQYALGENLMMITSISHHTVNDHNKDIDYVIGLYGLFIEKALVQRQGILIIVLVIGSNHLIQWNLISSINKFRTREFFLSWSSWN